jgi:biopolymer transport protein ExbD
MRKRRDYRKHKEVELDLLPMMNVFIVLIPMLLTSAVFLKVTVIDTNVPSSTSAPANTREEQNLALAITIKDQYFVVEGRGIEKRVIARTAADANEQLALTLADIVTRYPDNEAVMIIPQARTRYQDIIAVMDISRETGLPSASLVGAD